MYKNNKHMVFLHINESPAKVPVFNRFIRQGRRVFVLIYRDGCPPCIVTHPEWKKLKNVLKVDKEVIIADINEKFLNKIDCFGTKKIEILHYPTMIYISDKGQKHELYEGDRTVDGFVKWINHTLKTKQTGGRRRTKVKRRRTSHSRKLNHRTKKRRH
jgi:thiol-disulfide isomerase/thioredoxin